MKQFFLFLVLALSFKAFASHETGSQDQIYRIPHGGGRAQFGSIDLSKSATIGSSVLGIANGGTNNGSLGTTSGGVLYTDGSKVMNTGAGSSYQALISSGSSIAWTTLTAPHMVVYGTSYTTAGYLFTITTSTTAAVGDTYSNNGNTYTVVNALSAQNGQVLWVSGTGAPSASGTLTQVTGSGTASIAFTSSQATGAYSVPAGVKRLKIIAVGGGGGGGGASATGASQNAAGGGGGGGGSFVEQISNPSGTLYFTVGTGATGGAGGNSGGIGGTTAFSYGPTYAYGGSGGNGSGVVGASVFAVGIASNHGTYAGTYDLAMMGSDGQPGLSIAAGSQAGAGGGGGSFFCPPQAALQNLGSSNGTDALCYGGGGGGAANGASSSAHTGGSGKAGVLVIMEYNQ